MCAQDMHSMNARGTRLKLQLNARQAIPFCALLHSSFRATMQPINIPSPKIRVDMQLRYAIHFYDHFLNLKCLLFCLL